MEVIRNSLQNVRNYEEKKMSFIKIIRNIYTHGGCLAFYKGFGLNCFRMLPNAAIMFMAYEFLSKKLEQALRV